MEIRDEEEFMPPFEPPPLLRPEQVRHLAFQGWLPFDLPEDLLVQLRDTSAAAAAFFRHDDNEKSRLYPQKSRGTECGYYHISGEKEYITFRHEVHPESELEQHVQSAWHQAAQLLHRVLCDLSRGGFFNPAAWDSLVEGALEFPENESEMDNNGTLMRLFRYEANSGFAEQHVDIGLLTLCVGDGRGLQVLDYSHEPHQWTDATTPIILVADFARALFQNQVRPGAHRVISNPQGRSSLVFALRPSLRGEIDLTAFGGDGTVNARDYFAEVKRTKYNINATKDIREAQRKEQAERKHQKNPTWTPQGHG